MTTVIEKKHVHNVYKYIAEHWHQTRARKCTYWRVIVKFINSLEPNTILFDIGCGDCKYTKIREDIFMIGCDYCIELLKFSKDSEVNTGNILNLPYKDNVSDNTMCIAVLHHLSTEENRITAIKELIRITKINGKILLYMWSFEQNETRISSKKIENQDNYIKFNLQRKFISEKIKNIEELEYNSKEQLLVFERYCHFFKKDELENLLSNFKNIKIIDFGNDLGNWYVILEKII